MHVILPDRNSEPFPVYNTGNRKGAQAQIWHRLLVSWKYSDLHVLL